MTRFALFQEDKKVSPPFITRENLYFFIKKHRAEAIMVSGDSKLHPALSGITALRSGYYINEIADEELDEVQAEDLHFEDAASKICMDISGDTEGAEWPLEISILGMEEDYCQTYSMNENEIVALFNLLYRILKKDYGKKLEELQESVAHLNLNDT